MTRPARAPAAILLAAVMTLCAAHPLAAESAGNAPSEDTLPTGDEYLLLRICEAVRLVFSSEGASIWPGYSLAEQQFLVYVPDRWALLLNPAGSPEGFRAPPPKWPELGVAVAYHEGPYPGLVGQLEFGVDIGGIPTVAVGVPSSFTDSVEDPESTVFAYIVHEAFHQYQRAAFGEIPWSREEKYPIENTLNSALAWLEMRVLEEALSAAADGNRGLCEERTREFVTVRLHRWATAPPFVAEYEQGKELLEGTAKYVELRCVERAGSLDYVSSLDGTSNPMSAAFPPSSLPGLMLRELRARMDAGHLEPQDIPRNRIYAVAASQAYLLDHFDVPWKGQAEAAGSDFTFTELLRSRFRIQDEELPVLVERAKETHDFAAILARAEKATNDYMEACERALSAFEAQEGTAVAITVRSSGMSRSRLTSEKKWLMQNGRACLCRRFDVYTLSGEDWRFELKEEGLLEVRDWDEGTRRLSFVEPAAVTVALNGGPPAPLSAGSVSFESVKLTGSCFELRSSRTGQLDFDGDKLALDFVPHE
ncbi:MAG: hypothetical protein GF400_01885 [Candidatus Eisenbacteria bacterium]|nr:hypothetical protein [Candidatus Eisenbacteria bacterium]